MGIVAIAMDGPVASGKTAVGRLVAQMLGCRFLDTGIMYRAITWAAIETGVNVNDAAGLVRLAELQDMDVVFKRSGEASIRINGQDATPYLWQRDVEQNVSVVSSIAGVRNVLVVLQRGIASKESVVMVGRDIGTVVLPDAALKVFLTASATERAHRRYAELQTLGLNVPYEQVLTDLEQRDQLDSERVVAPLRMAHDAIVITTDDLSVNEVAAQILEKVDWL